MLWKSGGFVLILASLLLSIIGNIWAYNRTRNNKKSLIFSTFPVTDEQYIYKFDGIFEHWRFKQLKTIVDDKGSVQSNDTLEYEEFLTLLEFIKEFNWSKEYINPEENVEKMMAKMLPWNGENETEKIDAAQIVHLAKEFERASESLALQIRNFVKKFPKIKNRHFEHGDIDLLIGCKKFMRFLMSEESEKGSRMANIGSWLDIFSFMESPNANFKPLKQIFECSKVQNAALDARINEELYKEHEENRFKTQIQHEYGSHHPHNNIRQNQHRQRQLDAQINPLHQAVVEGAGPNGLMATFHLFLSGMRVLLVNDRPEKYIRSRIFLLDPKWMSQLRFFLGTMFDELFAGDQALADVNPGDIGFINCRNLEQKMWQRLKELSNYVRQRDANGEFLKVRAETLFEEIEFLTEEGSKYFVKFSTPKRLGNPEAGKENANKIKNELAPIIFDEKMKNNQMKLTKELEEIFWKEALEKAKEKMVEEKLENLLEVLPKIYKRRVGVDERILDYQPEGREGEVEMATPREWAEMELEGKVLGLKAQEKVQVDLVVCAGGARDRIRDKYLGKAQLRIVPTNYAVFVLEKGVFGEELFPQKTVFIDDKTMDDLKEYLDARNFNKLIEGSELLSEKLRKKYANLSQLMTKTLIRKEVEQSSPLNKMYEMDEFGHFKVEEGEKKVDQPIRIFENKESVLITSIPPFPLEEFLKEFEAEKKSRPAGVKVKYANFRKRLERIWSAAIYDLSVRTIVEAKMESHKLNLAENGELIEGENEQKPAIYFNGHPVNTAIFQQTVLSVKNPVKEMIGGGGNEGESSVVILAVGDANSNQHSLTASGLSTGRIGSEHISYLIRDYHRGKMGRHELVEDLRAAQNSVKERVLKKATEFANLLPEEDL